MSVGIVALLAAWQTGFFNATRERLEIEKIQLSQQKDKLSLEITNKDRELSDIKTQLIPFINEQKAITNLKEIEKRQILVRFSMNPDFSGVEIELHGTDGTIDWYIAPGASPKVRTNSHLGEALRATNDIRLLDSIKIDELRISPECLALATSRPNLKNLSIRSGDVDSNALSKIQVLDELYSLDLTNNKITTFEDCPTFKNVHYLILKDNPITDAGLKSLHVKFPKLFSLNLSGTKITDEGLKYIPRISDIGILSLSDTQVTEQGLLALLECKEIMSLRPASKLSDETYKKFRTKWPNTFSVVYDKNISQAVKH